MCYNLSTFFFGNFTIKPFADVMDGYFCYFEQKPLASRLVVFFYVLLRLMGRLIVFCSNLTIKSFADIMSVFSAIIVITK